MFSAYEQIFNVYPQCQEILITFGYTQNGEFLELKINENLTNSFFLPKVVTTATILKLCLQLTTIIFPYSCEVEKLNKFKEFVSNLQTIVAAEAPDNYLKDFLAQQSELVTLRFR